MSYDATNDIHTFAKSLASPDKSIRDKTITSLQAYLSTFTRDDSLSGIEMLKLWKALYYCMWLCDKVPVQQELSHAMSSLIFSIPNTAMKLLYIRMFYRTICREWSNIDTHRINKYYMCIRIFLRECYRLCLQMKWNKDITHTVNACIQQEALDKLPNGLRFHLSDICLTELSVVIGKKIPTAVLILVLQPFISSIVSSTDATYANRALVGTVEKLTEEEYREEESSNYSSIDLLAVQAVVFNAASGDVAHDKNRKRLYTCHKLMASTTGQQKSSFDIDTLSIEDEVVDAIEEAVVSVNKKKVTRNTTAAPKGSKADAVKDKKQAVIYSTAPVAATTDASGVDSKTVGDKRKVVDAAAADDAAGADFIASIRYTGSKKGYVFKKDKKGLGYYIDTYKPVAGTAQTNKRPKGRR